MAGVPRSQQSLTNPARFAADASKGTCNPTKGGMVMGAMDELINPDLVTELRGIFQRLRSGPRRVAPPSG